MPELLRCCIPIDLRGLLLFDAATYSEWEGDDLQSRVFESERRQLREVQQHRAVYIPAPEDRVDVRIYTGRPAKPQGFMLFAESYGLNVPSGTVVLATELNLCEWESAEAEHTCSIRPGKYHVSATGSIRQASEQDPAAFDIELVTGRWKPEVDYPVVRAVVALDVHLKRSSTLPKGRKSLGDGFDYSDQTWKRIVQHFLPQA